MSTIKVSQNYKVQVFTWIPNASETHCTETLPHQTIQAIYGAFNPTLCCSWCFRSWTFASKWSLSSGPHVMHAQLAEHFKKGDRKQMGNSEEEGQLTHLLTQVWLVLLSVHCGMQIHSSSRGSQILWSFNSTAAVSWTPGWSCNRSDSPSFSNVFLPASVLFFHGFVYIPYVWTIKDTYSSETQEHTHLLAVILEYLNWIFAIFFVF